MTTQKKPQPIDPHNVKLPTETGQPHRGWPTGAYAEVPAPGAAPLPEPIAALVDRVAALVAEAGIPPARLLPADSVIRCGAESDRIYHLDSIAAGLLVEQMRGRVGAIPKVPGQVGIVRAKYAGAWYIRVEVATCVRR